MVIIKKKGTMPLPTTKIVANMIDYTIAFQGYTIVLRLSAN